MSKLIQVFALDADGCEMNTPHHEGEESMKQSKAEAKRLLHDQELIDAGLSKVEIRVNGECIYDWFVA